jgi:phosphatidylserine synthase
MLLKLIIQTVLLNDANLIISADQLKFIIILLSLLTENIATIMKHIPNLITSLNLAAGFIALVFAANGDTVTASWLILTAMIFDFFDGFSARLLKAYSAIGKELDSLADVVSFGVAPAFIIHKMLVTSLGDIPPSVPGSGAGLSDIDMHWCTPVCAALRLTKLNMTQIRPHLFADYPHRQMQSPYFGCVVILFFLPAKSFTESLLFLYFIVAYPYSWLLSPLLSSNLQNRSLRGMKADISSSGCH